MTSRSRVMVVKLCQPLPGVTSRSAPLASSRLSDRLTVRVEVPNSRAFCWSGNSIFASPERALADARSPRTRRSMGSRRISPRRTEDMSDNVASQVTKWQLRRRVLAYATLT